MSKRWLFLLAVVALWCLTASLAMAQSQQSVAPAATVSATVAAPDPYVGGPIESKVPLARFCRDTLPSVCEGIPPGDPCDTPIGCVCGYSGGHVRCGRF